MIYAGIGSRSTPNAIQQQMHNIARDLAIKGWLLRSGGADGADTVFEQGCDAGCGGKEIWLPWRGFNGSQSLLYLSNDPEDEQLVRALAIAANRHPAWHRCSPAAKRLHARNVLQILGGDFETPVDKVICWTPDGKIVGGTATALTLAMEKGIPIENLAAV